MPLLTCPDCEGKVSDAASACPHCGRPVTKFAPQDLKNKSENSNTQHLLSNGTSPAGRSRLVLFGLVLTALVLFFPPFGESDGEFEKFRFLFGGRRHHNFSLHWVIWGVEAISLAAFWVFALRKK